MGKPTVYSLEDVPALVVGRILGGVLLRPGKTSVVVALDLSEIGVIVLEGESMTSTTRMELLLGTEVIGCSVSSGHTVDAGQVTVLTVTFPGGYLKYSSPSVLYGGPLGVTCPTS
jgi:hypothetical protein